MQSSLMQLEELQYRIRGHANMLLGWQQGTPCQTLRGLEGQSQHIPNFKRIQPQHLPQPVLAAQEQNTSIQKKRIQEQTLRQALQGAQYHCALHLILQKPLSQPVLAAQEQSTSIQKKRIQEQTLRQALQGAQYHCALHLILQNPLLSSLLICATGRGASDNRNSLLYLYLDQGTPFHAHHNMLVNTYSFPAHTHTLTSS